MRAFAVLAVVAFHARPSVLPGGFIGVDVFFVISGFLISSLILDSVRQGTFSFSGFYSRRIRRILPALVTVLVATFVAGWLTLLPRDLIDLNKLIVSSVFFVPNLELWSEAGYFAGNSDKRPLLHLWSLGVEEQFYLFWPFVLIMFSKRSLPWIIALLAGLSFVSSVIFIDRYPTAVFYFPMTRLWELAGGAFLAWRERRYLVLAQGAAADFPVWLREACSLTGAALLSASYFWIKPSLPFPGWWALPPVIGAMLVIAAGPQALINRFVLSNPIVVFVGLISYPLYLWHWPVLVFFKIVKDGAAPNDGIYLLAVFLLAWLTYQFIEKPIRRHKAASWRTSTVPGLLACSAVLAIAAWSVIGLGGVPGRYSENLRPFLTYDYFHNATSGSKCLLQSAAMVDDWTESRCVDPQTDPKTPLIALWGDSHAAHLVFGLQVLQRDRAFRLAQMTGAACPPFFDVDIIPTPFCRAENDFFMRKMAELHPDIVVVTADYLRYDEPRLGPLKNGIEALKQAKVPRIVVIGPVPHWNVKLPDILIDVALHNQERIPSILGPEVQTVMPEAELRTLAEKEGVAYISPMDVLCQSGFCVTMTDYGPQYVVSFDSEHFTNAGSQLLVRRIADQLFAGVAIGSR